MVALTFKSGRQSADRYPGITCEPNSSSKPFFFKPAVNLYMVSESRLALIPKKWHFSGLRLRANSVTECKSTKSG